MIQVFITTIFIAEIIIAASIIFNIYKLDIKVLAMSDDVSKFKLGIKKDMKNIRYFLKIIKYKTRRLQTTLKEKQDEATLKLIKNLLIYTSLFVIKGKYKNLILGYQLAQEIYEGFQEA